MRQQTASPLGVPEVIDIRRFYHEVVDSTQKQYRSPILLVIGALRRVAT